MKEIPLPLVRFNQGVIVTTVLLGALLRQPLFTTALLAVLAAGLLLGPRANAVLQVGKRLLARRLPGARTEAAELQRFNQSIAVLMLAGAQAAFVAGAPLLGWGLALAVALAAGMALAGFCVGCLLYYQVKMLRYRLRA